MMRPNVSETRDPLDLTLLPPTDGMSVSLTPPRAKAGPQQADHAVSLLLRMTLASVGAVALLRLASYVFSPLTFLFGLTLASVVHAVVWFFRGQPGTAVLRGAGFAPALLLGMLLFASWTTGPASLRFTLWFLPLLAVAVTANLIAGRYLVRTTEDPEQDTGIRPWRAFLIRAAYGPALWGLILLASWTTGPAPLRFGLFFLALLAVAGLGDLITGRYLVWMTEDPELDAEVRRRQRERWRDRWHVAPWDQLRRAAEADADADAFEEEGHPEKAELVRLEARELRELALYPLGYLVYFVSFIGAVVIALRAGPPFFHGMIASVVFVGLVTVTAALWNARTGLPLVWKAVVHWLTHEANSSAQATRRPPDQPAGRKELTFGSVLLVTLLIILPSAAYFPAVMFFDPDPWADASETPLGIFGWSLSPGQAAAEGPGDSFSAMTKTPEGWLPAVIQGAANPPAGSSRSPFLLASLVSLVACVGIGPLLLLASWSLLCGRVLAGNRREILADESEADEMPPHERWNDKVERLQASDYEVETPFGVARERDHLWLGTNAATGAAVILDRNILHEHAWLLGDSGTGKTHRGFSPMVAQLVRRNGKLGRETGRGDSSVVIVDLKGDPALFHGARIEADRADIPFRWFTSVAGKSTYVFNPFLQSYIPDVSEEQFAGNLLQALGLEYGTDYGRVHFSYVNRDVLAPILRAHGSETKSLEKLNRDLLAQRSKTGTKKIIKELNRKDVEDARHVFGVVDSLSHYEALNAVPGDGHPPEVFENAIDMADVFARPQVLYFYLPATFGGSSVKEIGRLALFSLLTAAAVKVNRGEKLLQIYLFIDEFQQILSDKLAIFLEMARSHRIGVVFANQHRSQLKTKDADLVETLETVAFRQTFGASGAAAKKALVDSSGEALYHLGSLGRSTAVATSDQSQTVTRTESETTLESIGPRLRPNDVARVSDHPDLSIVEISRGKGFSRYAGLPLVVTTQYHVPLTEFEHREKLKWPTHPHTITPTVRKKIEPVTSPPAEKRKSPPVNVEAKPMEQAATVTEAESPPATSTSPTPPPAPTPSPEPETDIAAWARRKREAQEAERQRFQTKKPKGADDEPKPDPGTKRRPASGTARKRGKQPDDGKKPSGTE